MDEGYYVGWGTLALINAGLAQVKGRSRLITFIASLFFGPFVTLVLVLMDYRAPADPTAKAAAEGPPAKAPG